MQHFVDNKIGFLKYVNNERRSKDSYLMKMVTWKIWIKKKQGIQLGILPQSLILMIDLGFPSPLCWRIMTAGALTFHLWMLKSLSDQFYHQNVHMIWWDSPQSTEGASRYYGRTLAHHLPKVSGVWGGPCWLEGSQCYSSLQKRLKGRPRALQHVSLTTIPGEIMEKVIQDTTERH